MNLLTIYIEDAINIEVKKRRSQAQSYDADVPISTQARSYFSIGKFSNFFMSNISILLIYIPHF